MPIDSSMSKQNVQSKSKKRRKKKEVLKHTTTEINLKILFGAKGARHKGAHTACLHLYCLRKNKTVLW